MRGSFIFSILALVCMPALSSADVKGTLTNGRETVADACEEEVGRFICTKWGGPSTERSKRRTDRVQGCDGISSFQQIFTLGSGQCVSENSSDHL